MQTPREIQELKYVKYFFKENTLLHSVLSFSLSSFYLKVKLPFLFHFLFKLLFKVGWFFFPWELNFSDGVPSVTGQAWINSLYSSFSIPSSLPTLFQVFVFLIITIIMLVGIFVFHPLKISPSTQSSRLRSSMLAAYIQVLLLYVSTSHTPCSAAKRKDSCSWAKPWPFFLLDPMLLSF